MSRHPQHTRDPQPILLPEPGTLRLGVAPFCHGPAGVSFISWTFLVGASVVLLSGLILFGWPVIRVAAISIAVALLAESVFSLLTRRGRSWSESHALLIGLLFALTLPPLIDWRVVVWGSIVSVAVGQNLGGGLGNYTWHPVALARVAMQMLFHDQVTRAEQPVLAAGHLLWGNLTRGRPLPALQTWASAAPPAGTEAWIVPNISETLQSALERVSPSSSSAALAELIRDRLPPWPEAIAGLGGGAIGTACVLASLVAGLLLLWRGFLRWPMFLSAVLAAAAMIFILPLHVLSENGEITHFWLPGAAVWEGLPVGLVYLTYQLTAGEFLLVLVLLAPDPTSSPLTTRGHIRFGMVIGIVAMLLRIAVGVPAAGYWALLVANTLVPVINRRTRRRVFGT
ncbi:MAG: RnfABCDGE type electron transport complex subunit D [Phycisphaerales bacterium]|nr:RnfABCDGE type electron transport complex subunit D [Phycisphaerales bacterium]